MFCSTVIEQGKSGNDKDVSMRNLVYLFQESVLRSQKYTEF
jgi:hypothetical protein